jgi:3-oxoacyl-[acyl-carrier protein] reductase
MGDFLLDLSQNPQARKLIKSLGLPIPLPEKLVRDKGAWPARPLADKDVIVGGPGSELAAVIGSALATAGANAYLADPALAPAFDEPGAAFGRPARDLAALGDRSAWALVFDATGIKDVAGLRGLYDFFHPIAGKIARSGRVVVLGRPATTADAPEVAASRSALEGFVRSLAKEIGKKGATANLVTVEPGAEARVAGALRFFLSPRSAFVSGQPLAISSKAKGGAEPSFVRSLEKRVALVTGAARGIGAATARLLAAEGAHVLVLDRPADDGPTSQLAREIGGTAVLVDITAPDAPQQIAEAVKAKGGVDIVVHNAGITRDKTLARMSEEQWDQALQVNLGAVVRINEALDKQLRQGGRIICLSSVAGIAGNLGQTNYSASKAGLIAYVKALAERVSARGITVNAIAPGFIETRLTAAIPVTIREAGRRLSALGQGGLPEDVGNTITFLASPGAQGITGAVLRVCGGALIGA